MHSCATEEEDILLAQDKTAICFHSLCILVPIKMATMSHNQQLTLHSSTTDTDTVDGTAQLV